MTKTIFMKGLRGGTALSALALLGAGAGVMLATPAFAQDTTGTATSAAPNPQAAAATTDDQSADQGGQIVVTGTLFRTTTATPSPVTVITSDDLEKRGINTVQDAVQRLSSNGSGTLPNSFSANGAFASGASGASLRGLTTSSTLVLFDGLRAAYYPLADDGVRNFVDLNSIPDAIVDRVEVLKDGASSTYGADAVAGVVNIITKKQITGLHANASAGISQWGDAGEQRLDATWGFGDLDQQGFNFYVNAEYQKDDMLKNADRGYPYNTSDLSKLCGASGSCRTNSVVNGIQFDGTFGGVGTTLVPVIRPYNAANSAAVVNSRYQLYPGATCGALPTISYTGPQLNAAAGLNSPFSNCLQDSRRLFNVIAPEDERLGASARLTVKVGDNAQAYAMFNFYQNDVFFTGAPQAIRANTPAGGVAATTASIALPVYVCPRTGSATFVNSIPTVAGGCTSATTGAVLNPNNPFAAAGNPARILYQLSDIPLSNERKTRTYRGAVGISGTIGDGWDFSLEGTAMRQDLAATYKGYVYFQHLIDVIADGSYNFVNPSLNSQAVRNYLAPNFTNNSYSEMYQAQASLSHALFDLPGGPLMVGVGGSIRYESVIAPSANPVVANQPFQRYETINGFGTSGNRTVYSGYYEVNAPVFDMLELNTSGRYDSYSSGQSNFSPKFGAKFTPIKQIAFRGTWSKGFRIPSFAEAYGLPTTGYITQTPPAAFTAACTGTPKPVYCTAAYSLGLTSVGNPNLKPETSTNITLGAIFEPVSELSLSVDYYNITKKNLITGADYSPQIGLYYAGATAGTTLAPGITGITVDTTGFATQTPGTVPYPLLSTIEYGFINADSQKSSGIDFDLEAHLHLGSVKWTSSVDANYVIELSQTIGGHKQRYDGTLGAYQITSASGTPKWRGSWQNTLDFGVVTVTGTVWYNGGYEEGAEDDGNTKGVCAPGGSYALYRDGTVVLCRVKAFIYGDITASVHVNDRFTLYTNVLNVTNAKAPYDPSTYGASNYNPAWSNMGVMGRYFRVGARVNF